MSIHIHTKKKINDLAIFGGDISFPEKIYVGRPNQGNRERLMKSLDGVLDRNFLTNNGPCVQKLEQKIVDFLGVKHCFLVCNATVGLEIAIRSLDLSGEVIVPSMTFIATAHALKWQHVTPIFCDIDPDTCNIDVKKIEALITPKTTAILGVHLFGRPCDVETLARIASRHNIKLLYDAAHAFGCSYNGTMIGNFGDAEVFSFHATKFFNSLEGGAIVTNDDILAEKIRLMRNFGILGYDEISSVGINGKMHEFSAAVGLNSFEGIGDFIAVNKKNYDTYQRNLIGIPGVEIIVYDKNETCNFQYVVLKIDEQITHIHRDDILKVLWAENVIARRYFYPGCHRSLPYADDPQYATCALPATEKISNALLSLPTGTAVDDYSIEIVCDIIKFCVTNAAEITSKIKNIQ